MPPGLETTPEQLFLACVLRPSICMLQPYLQDPAVVAVGFLEGKWLSSPLTPFVVSRKKTKALGGCSVTPSGGTPCSAWESQCRVLPNAALPLWFTGQPYVQQRSPDERQEIGCKQRRAAALGTRPCAAAAGDSSTNVSSTARQERSFPYTEVSPI